MNAQVSEIKKFIKDEYNVSRETMEGLEGYVSLLKKWNEKINLIRFESDEDLWQRHILDSTQLFKYINPDIKLMDLGSGGGLPGIILSILGVKHSTLVESDNRKAVFLNQASRFSNHEVTIKNVRIEDLEPQAVGIITSRALCSIEKICSFIARLQNNGKILLLKGKSTVEEITEAEQRWQFEYKLHKSITSNDSFIVEINNIKSKKL
jgi:16S rRNA (guanine527-N7)-methyltransferase